MEKKHNRPVSSMEFLKPANCTNPSKYSLRQRKVERMSRNQIEAIVNKNELLEEENKKLKAIVESLA